MAQDVLFNLKVNDEGSVVIEKFSEKSREALSQVSQQTQQANQNFSQTTETVKNLGNEGNKLVSRFLAFNQTLMGIQGRLGLLSQGFTRLARDFSVFSTAMTLGMYGAMRGIIDTGESLDAMSKKMGLSTETLSEFMLASQKTNVSMGSIAMGIRLLSAGMERARKSTSELSITFARLGIETKEASGKLRPTKDILYDLADVFSKMEDGASKVSLAIKLFGRTGSEMIPLLNLGREGLEKNAEAVRRLGAVYSKDFAAGAADLKSSMAELRTAFVGVRISIMENLLPKITEYVNKIRDSIPKIKDWIENHRGVVSTWGDMAVKSVLLAAALGPLSIGISAIVRVTSSAITVVRGLAGAFTFLAASPAAAAVAALGMVALAVVKLIKDMENAKKKFEEGVAIESLTEKLKEDPERLVLVWKKFTEKLPLLGKQYQDAYKKVVFEAGNDMARILATIETKQEYSLLKEPLMQITKNAEIYLNAYRNLSEKEKERLAFYVKDVSTAAKMLKIPEEVLVSLGAFQEKVQMINPLLKNKKRNIEELRESMKNWVNITDDMRSSASDLGLQLTALVYEKLEKLKGALEDQDLQAASTRDSWRKMLGQIANYKVQLGEAVTAQEAWWWILAQGVKETEENQAKIGLLNKALLELQTRHKQGAVDTAEFVKGLKILEEAAKDIAPEIAEQVRQMGFAWSRALLEVSEKYGILINLLQSLSTKRREWNQRLISLDDQLEESAKNLKKTFTEFYDKALESLTKQPRMTTLQEATKQAKKMLEDERKTLEERQEALIKDYEDREKAITKYYQNERRLFEDSLKKYDIERAMIDALNLYRIQASKARSESELAAAKETYLKQEKAIRDYYFHEIEIAETAELTKLRLYKEKYSIPYLKMMDDLLKKSKEKEEFFLKSITDLAKKHPEMTTEQLIEAAKKMWQGVQWEAEAQIKRLGYIFESLGNLLANNLKEEAELIRAKMSADMSYAERLNLEAKARMTQAWADFASVGGKFIDSIINGLRKMKEEGKKSIGDLISYIGVELSTQLGVAIGGVIAGGKKSYAAEGGALGASIGMAIAGPIGAAIGGLLGGIFGGLFKKAKSESEKIKEEIGRLADSLSERFKGLQRVSDSTAEKIYNMAKKFGIVKAELLNLADLINDTGLTMNNFKKYADMIVQGLETMKNATGKDREIVASLKKEMGEAFSAMVKWVRLLDNEGQRSFINLIKRMKETGQNISELNEYINQWLSVGIDGIKKVIAGIAPASSQILELQKAYDEATEKLSRMRKGTDAYVEQIKLVNQLKRELDKLGVSQTDYTKSLEIASRQFVAMFNAVFEQTGSLSGALSSLAEPLQLLFDKYNALGKQVPASLKPFETLAKLKKDHAELLEALDGNLQILKALGNTGFLTAESIRDVSQNLSIYYQRLIEYGVDSKNALALIAPTLSDLEWYAKQYGISLDDATKKLIDQAKESGVYKEHAKDLIGTLEAGFNRIIKKFDELIDKIAGGGKSLAGAFETASQTGIGELEKVAMKVNEVYNNMINRDWNVDMNFSAEYPELYNKKKIISAQSGGSWYVNDSWQPFVAHRGEVVRIGRPDEMDRELKSILKEISQSLNAKTGETHITFNIDAVDGNSVYKIVTTKIVPALEDLAKKEKFVLPAKAIRG